jgi:nitroreductase
MFNDLSSPLNFLETRRSGKPRDMVEPGPSSAELDRIFRIASRVPDHGKLAPWHFVVIEDRDAFAELLARAYAEERPDAGKLEKKANDEFARQAPILVVAMSRPAQGSKVPLREQRLSMGAAAFNLQLAAASLGYVAGWLTGWAAYSRTVIEALGGSEQDEVAGFLFLGSASKPLEERPRPELSSVVSRWPS